MTTWLDEYRSNQTPEQVEAERAAIQTLKDADRARWTEQLPAQEAALAERRAQQLLDDPDGDDDDESDDDQDDFLPLDRFPQIVFGPPEQSVTPAVVTLLAEERNVTETKSRFGDPQSVTTAGVTLTAAPQTVTHRYVPYSQRPEPGTYDIEPMYPDERDHNFDQYGRQINRCTNCRKWFHVNRYHAKTCTSNCRKAASRRKEAINREVQRVQDALGNLERCADRWPDLFQDVMSAIGQCSAAAGTVSRRVAPKGDNR